MTESSSSIGTSNMSSPGNTSTIITKLQALRLLPPPANDLVPLLVAIAAFSCATLVVGHDHLQLWWTHLIQSCDYPPETMFILGTFSVYMTMYWGYSLMVHTAEHVIPATLHHFKIQPNINVTPWSEIRKMVPLVLFNQIMLAVPLLKVAYLIIKWRGTRHGSPADDAMAEFATHVPTIGHFVLTVVIHVGCNEIWFYTMHRALHSPTMYGAVHKLHHTYKAPCCLESAYVHPIEFLMIAFTVFLIGPLVAGAPLITWLIWMGTVTFLQVHDHSGYWFPFFPKALMHDYHHQRTDCCFGLLGLLDGIFGTVGGFSEFVKAQEKKCKNGDLSSKKKT